MSFSLSYKKVIEVLEKNGLLSATNAEPSGSVPFTSISYDSRYVDSDTLFICKGVHFKEDYYFQAKNKGIRAYVSERIYDTDTVFFQVSDVKKALSVLSIEFYQRPSDSFKLIGITGTAGKTTTTYMIHSVLNAAAGHETGIISTNETYCGGEHKEAENTTPESLRLQALFSEAREHDIGYVTMEVSSQAYSVDRVYDQTFDIGIFMNIDKDHVGGPEHPSYEHYLKCKLQLIKNSKTMLIYARTRELHKIIETARNSDCKLVMFDVPDEIAFGKDAAGSFQKKNAKTGALTGMIPDELVYTPSPDPALLEKELGRKLYLYNITDAELLGTDGFTFTMEDPDGNVSGFNCDISGRFNVVNAAAACVSCLELGIDPGKIADGLHHVYVPGRMNIYKKGNTDIIVDYAHNRLTLFEFLKSAASDYADRKINIVIGAAGKNHLRRDDIAVLCSQYADHIYITDEDPDFEDPLEICEDIARRIPEGGASWEIVVNRTEAIEKSISDALSHPETKNLIAILGKGSERFIKIRGGHEDYESDSGVVERILEK
ncbi:MAG: UDP-N-acetylmuramyl-tripeptide synthetase [Clostridiales bacterium]|nr:UDP-N-acetylmuramyl-tripeptide synthetase [Clostridiales bacterium]MBS5877081.1 UDP-N-acetylmuramyl-tripeptide synthetase [Clostridiales bacterium]MDU0939074.1 UDP-N-acetylmuramyl-tripeptide synthetase [Clostridiales bacterium]MDU1041791.1 UDP-N-acetylmuramyl-tripeptide synthetase [Clostridiales bacterium]MDU3489594.1 UDP-N-acetylmuramyl-tripeptide synthetase [Clostridiales bacterium]